MKVAKLKLCRRILLTQFSNFSGIRDEISCSNFVKILGNISAFSPVEQDIGMLETSKVEHEKFHCRQSSTALSAALIEKFGSHR